MPHQAAILICVGTHEAVGDRCWQRPGALRTWELNMAVSPQVRSGPGRAFMRLAIWLIRLPDMTGKRCGVKQGA